MFCDVSAKLGVQTGCIRDFTMPSEAHVLQDIFWAVWSVMW